MEKNLDFQPAKASLFGDKSKVGAPFLPTDVLSRMTVDEIKNMKQIYVATVKSELPSINNYWVS